jgi:hypothetical protein
LQMPVGSVERLGQIADQKHAAKFGLICFVHLTFCFILFCFGLYFTF